jgi:RNA polymerase sigma-70 factor (ECF subfamily)
LQHLAGEARPATRRRPADSSDRRNAIDAFVLEGFRRGDESAVREMYRAYGNLVYGVALRALGRRELAEEATQQTFVRAWQAADRIDVLRDPAPWLATIARNTAIDVHRRETRRETRAIDSVSAEHPALVSTSPDLAALDAVWQVRQAIDALPTEERAVVQLQYMSGMTHREIAATLGLAIGTVKSRLHRAHGKLAHLLSHLREVVS